MRTRDDRGDYLEIRRLRKKLRQIENLERVCRSLNEEETLKVSKKREVRDQLQDILSKIPSSGKCDNIPTAVLISPEEECSSDHTADESNCSPQSSENQDEKSKGPLSELDAIKRPNDGQGDGIQSRSERPSSPKRPKVEHGSKPTKNQTNSGSEGKNNLQKIWQASTFSVCKLDGHNDLITAVAADGNLIVTASRDTTVKVWNADTRKELYSLRGHSASVTCLILLREDHSDELSRYLGLAGSHRLTLSGACDSTIILWSITTGELKKSIYTFNTVTCAAYIQPEVCFITATDGGKLQMWDAISGTMLRSFTAYDDAYSCIVAFENHLYTAAMEGIIKIWEVQDRDLKVKFSLEDLKLPNGTEIILRMVRCMEVWENWVFYGDDGPNIKAFNWKTGEIQKYVNRVCEWGATDSIVCTGQELIASTYDIDKAIGCMNVRLYPCGEYLCSLDDGETGRISSIACTSTSSGNLRIITGGMELKVWNILQAPHSGRRVTHVNDRLQKPLYIEGYSKDVQQSEYESSEQDSEDGDAYTGLQERTYIPVEITHSRGIWSYCSIL